MRRTVKHTSTGSRLMPRVFSMYPGPIPILSIFTGLSSASLHMLGEDIVYELGIQITKVDSRASLLARARSKMPSVCSPPKNTLEHLSFLHEGHAKS